MCGALPIPVLLGLIGALQIVFAAVVSIYLSFFFFFPRRSQI